MKAFSTAVVFFAVMGGAGLASAAPDAGASPDIWAMNTPDATGSADVTSSGVDVFLPPIGAPSSSNPGDALGSLDFDGPPPGAEACSASHQPAPYGGLLLLCVSWALMWRRRHATSDLTARCRS